MGFFDIIEQIQLSKPEAPPQETAGHQEAPPREDFRPDQSDRNRAEGKPEPLAFLQPCQVCGSRDFFFTLDSGFSCSGCHPGGHGQRVRAAGDIPPDPIRADPQDDMEISGIPAATADILPRSRRMVTPEEALNFTAAWPWIKENMPQLLKAGWTRAALVRRGRLRHPVGNWGIAWLSIWREPSLSVSINIHGNIVFTYPGRDRAITFTTQKPNNGEKDSKVQAGFFCTM